jgi:hypothetical protein
MNYDELFDSALRSASKAPAQFSVVVKLSTDGGAKIEFKPARLPDRGQAVQLSSVVVEAVRRAAKAASGAWPLKRPQFLSTVAIFKECSETCESSDSVGRCIVELLRCNKVRGIRQKRTHKVRGWVVTSDFEVTQ